MMGIRLASSLQRAALGACGIALLLAGCGQFFPPLNSGGGGGGASTGDYLYAGNLASGNLGIGAFTFANSSLTALSGSPFSAGGIAPIALAVTPNDSYLYVGGGASQQTNVYPINSNGTLGTGVAVGAFGPTAIQVDTSGGWLIGFDALLGQVYSYQIDSSNGTLSSLSASVATLNGCNPSSDMAGLTPALVIAPNDNYVYASCGTAGIYVLSFSSSNGALNALGSYTPKNNAADSGLAIATLTSGSSTSYYLLAPETVTNGVHVFAINSSSGQFSDISGSPFNTGHGPDAVLVDSTNAYVYVANRTDGTISDFTLGAGGKLTAIGSAVGTGSSPVALVEDKSHTYVVAVCSGGNADLETYTIGTGGALVSFKNSATGTDPTQASSLAATH